MLGRMFVSRGVESNHGFILRVSGSRQRESKALQAVLVYGFCHLIPDWSQM